MREHDPETLCLGCGCELPTRDDVHRIPVAGTVAGHGPFCAACAESAKGMFSAQWLDEQWQRQRPH